MAFFENFILTYYDLTGANVMCRDILKRVRFRRLLDDIPYYERYQIQENEEAWHIAYKLYGDANLHWVIYLVNDITDPYFDWPLSTRVLHSWLTQQFGDLPTAYQTVHHYEDAFGNEIDKDTHDALPLSERKIVYAYDYWVAKNEEKREIKLVPKEFAIQMNKELGELMRKI